MAVPRQLTLAVSAVAAMARQDPVHLAIQVARRVPPGLRHRAAGALLARARAGGTQRLVALWLADRRPEAVASLPAAVHRARRSRRLLGEIAVELGQPGLVSAADSTTAARDAWRRGDLTEAVQRARTARPGRLPERYASELAMAQAATRLPSPLLATGTTSPGGVLHVLTNSLPHTSSGYTLRSHAVLRSLRDRGVRVAAVTRIGYPATVGRVSRTGTDRVDGIPYHRLIPWTLPADAEDRAVLATEMLGDIAARAHPAALHTTTPAANGLVTQAVARALGVPWLYEVRGLHEHTWVAGQPTPAARRHAAESERFRLAREQEAQIAASSDHVITLSRTMRDDLVARGVPAERITIVPNAVDSALFDHTEPADSARRALGLPEADLWVGTVSSLVDYEGLDLLIDAVALLRRQGRDVRACLVGDGVARPALIQHAHEAGLGAHIVFPGRVDRASARRWCQALDVVVVPRRDVPVCRLVTPLKPIEAMALGRPVVASNLPALAEVLEDGAGVLVPADDAPALAEALHPMLSPDRRARTVPRGLEAARARTWANNADRYHEIYQRLGVAA